MNKRRRIANGVIVLLVLLDVWLTGRYITTNHAKAPQAMPVAKEASPVEPLSEVIHDPSTQPSDATSLYLLLQTHQITSEIFTAPTTQPERTDFFDDVGSVNAIGPTTGRRDGTYIYVADVPTTAPSAKPINPK